MDKLITNLYNYGPQFCEKIGKFNSKISGKDALFVWQFVRHSKRYQVLYDYLIENHDELEEVIFCSMLGVSEPVDYRNPELPPKFYFQQNLVQEFDVRKFLRDKNYQKKVKQYLKIPVKLSGLAIEGDDSVYAFIVNLNDNPDSIAKKVKTELKERRKKLKALKYFFSDEKPKTLRGSSVRITLKNWLISYHYRVVENLPHNKVRDKYALLTDKSPSNSEIIDHIEQFRKLAENSPNSFFRPKK